MQVLYKPKAGAPPQTKDEVTVTVVSALGGYCGSFVWPKKDLEMLKDMNKTKTGFYFVFEGADLGRFLPLYALLT